MEPTPERIQDFRHARWKVKFTAHLIALHECKENKGSVHWLQEHGEFLNRHAMAKETLSNYPKEWNDLYP